jgi:DNA-directed RNA polymerase specialized sigma24 family protein
VRWWLHRIVTNASLDLLRRRPPGPFSIEAEAAVAGPETDPHGRYERRETVERALLRADDILAEHQRGSRS